METLIGIDIDYARKIGIKVGNSNYGANGVADFTLTHRVNAHAHAHAHAHAIKNYKQEFFC